MSGKLFFDAVMKFVLGAVLICILLFLPAGTLCYPNAWLFMGVLFVPMLGVGSMLMIRNPNLLRKRLRAKEKKQEQIWIVKLSGLMFLAGFVLAGLDFRFQWIPLPVWVPRIAATIFLLAYLLYAEVLRENSYLSRTIEVHENQKVIDTGLYGIVRHPMYSATVLLFLSMPLVLGSVISFAVFLIYPLLIAARIREEERLLEAELPGYTEYKQKVRCRLIPYVW